MSKIHPNLALFSDSYMIISEIDTIKKPRLIDMLAGVYTKISFISGYDKKRHEKIVYDAKLSLSFVILLNNAHAYSC